MLMRRFEENGQPLGCGFKRLGEFALFLVAPKLDTFAAPAAGFFLIGFGPKPASS